MSDSLQPRGLYPTRVLCLWDSPGKNTGVAYHALLQGIFRTQGLNLCLMSSALAGGFFTTSTTWEALLYSVMNESFYYSTSSSAFGGVIVQEFDHSIRWIVVSHCFIMFFVQSLKMLKKIFSFRTV